MDLKTAIDKLINKHHIGDSVYDVRERADMSEMPSGVSSWDHPDVVEFSECITVLENYLKE